MGRSLPVPVIFFSMCLLVVLTGCTGVEDSVKSTACSVPRTLISNVLGSDEFSVHESDDRLPLDADAEPTGDEGTGNYRCDIKNSDGQYLLRIEVAFMFDTVLDAHQYRLEGTEEHFSTAGGEAGVSVSPNDTAALWVCGNVGVTAEGADGTDRERWSQEDARALITDLAHNAGCWSLEKSKPEQ